MKLMITSQKQQKSKQWSINTHSARPHVGCSWPFLLLIWREWANKINQRPAASCNCSNVESLPLVEIDLLNMQRWWQLRDQQHPAPTPPTDQPRYYLRSQPDLLQSFSVKDYYKTRNQSSINVDAASQRHLSAFIHLFLLPPNLKLLLALKH